MGNPICDFESCSMVGGTVASGPGAVANDCCKN